MRAARRISSRGAAAPVARSLGSIEERKYCQILFGNACAGVSLVRNPEEVLVGVVRISGMRALSLRSSSVISSSTSLS